MDFQMCVCAVMCLSECGGLSCLLMWMPVSLTCCESVWSCASHRGWKMNEKEKQERERRGRFYLE